MPAQRRASTSRLALPSPPPLPFAAAGLKPPSHSFLPLFAAAHTLSTFQILLLALQHGPAMPPDTAPSRPRTRVLLDRAFALLVCALVAAVAVGRVMRGSLASDMTQGAALLMVMSSLLAASFTPSYCRGGRRWAVAACRLLLCARLLPGAPRGLPSCGARQMDSSSTPPASC